MSFDYKAAWTALARPEYESLDLRAKRLYAEVMEKCADSKQGKNLLIPWVDAEIRENFESLPAPLLSYAARVIYFFGHWSPEGHHKIGNGAYWKFANLADQTLRRTLGLAQTYADSAEGGVSIRVHDGLLRVCAQTRDTWRWRELGLATPENLGAWATVAEPMAPEPRTMSLQRCDDYERALTGYLDRCFEVVAGKESTDVLRWLTVANSYKVAE